MEWSVLEGRSVKGDKEEEETEPKETGRVKLDLSFLVSDEESPGIADLSSTFWRLARLSFKDEILDFRAKRRANFSFSASAASFNCLSCLS